MEPESTSTPRGAKSAAVLVAGGVIALLLTVGMIFGQVTLFIGAFSPAVSTHTVAQTSSPPVVPAKHQVTVMPSPKASESGSPEASPSTPVVAAVNPVTPVKPAAPAAPLPAQTITAFNVAEDQIGTDNCPTNTTQDQMLITWSTSNAMAVVLVYAETGFTPVSYSVAASGSKILPERCGSDVNYTLQASGSAPLVSRTFPIILVVIKPVVTITSYAHNYLNMYCIPTNQTGTYGVTMSWTATGATAGTISSPSLVVPLTSSQLASGSHTFTVSCGAGQQRYLLTLTAPNANPASVQQYVDRPN